MFNASKMARTPTLFVSSTLYRDDTSLVTDPRVTRLYPLWRQAALAATVATAKTTDQTVTRANLENQVQQVKAMVRGGGLVTAGTDSPIDHLAISTHMNLRAMVIFGLTPREALVTATSNSGAYLGEQLGRIAAGWFADLAIIDGDPLNIEDAANVTAVVASGATTRSTSCSRRMRPTPTRRAARRARRPGRRPRPPGERNRVLAPVPTHPSTKAFWWNAPEVVEAARESCCTTH